MNLRVLTSLLIILGLAASLQSCKTTQQASVGTKELNGKWILKTFNGQKSTSLFTHKTPTLIFDTDKSVVHGNGGCNSYNGAFTLVKNKLTIANIASTMMMCPGENKESLYIQALSNNPELSFNKDILTFKQNGKVALEFEKAKPLTNNELSGQWVLQSIEGASANVYFKERIPTANFNAESNRISGNSGCNTYGATFELKDGKIEIKPMMGTRMACSDAMEGEAKFMRLLPGVSDIELENGLLTLKRDGVHVATFVKK